MNRILEAVIVIVCATPFLWMLARRVHEQELFRHQFDGVRMGNPQTGGEVEVIDPPFWRIGRFWKKRKASVKIELMQNDHLGVPRLKLLSAVVIEDPHDRCPLCKRPFKRLP